MKKVVKIVVDVLAWIVLIFAFIITVLVFSAERNKGIPQLFGIMPMTVQTDSMVPTFKTGDLLFVKEADLYQLKKDDVISFYMIVDGNRIVNTHRIVEVQDEGSSRSFITRGDNNGQNDPDPVSASDIIGVWSGSRIPGGGNVIDFLRTKTGFFIFIVIPMAIFFLFELYKFITVLIEAKKPKISAEEEEEIKKKAIEEYLAKEKEESGTDKTGPEDNG